MSEPEEDPDVHPELTLLTIRNLDDILELVGVQKQKGKKDVYLKTVAALFAQSSSTSAAAASLVVLLRLRLKRRTWCLWRQSPIVPIGSSQTRVKSD